MHLSAIASALALGLVVGALFGLFKLTPPAPINWAGVAGIVGIVGGWMIASAIWERFS